MKKINYTFLTLVLLSGFLFMTKVPAQINTQTILTWQADNFYPANYEGKAQATPNTPVSVSAEIFAENKLLDSSQANFIWYVDEKFAKEGVGAKEIVFTVTKSEGDSHFIRVVIKQNDKLLEASTRIPISKPLVAIDAPRPNQLIPAGSQVLLQAIPYFFNINTLQDLNFSWQINNQIQKGANGNRLILKIGAPQTPSQNAVEITVSAQNKSNLSEFAKKNIKLLINNH